MYYNVHRCTGFLAEGIKGRERNEFVAVKTHENNGKWDAAIFLIRNPYKAIVSYYNWMSTGSHTRTRSEFRIVCVYQCCGHYRGITINYHCNYLSIKALQLPLPLRTSTKVINYHCNYISTIAITITNYRFILGCLQKLLHLTETSYMW